MTFITDTNGEFITHEWIRGSLRTTAITYGFSTLPTVMLFENHPVRTNGSKSNYCKSNLPVATRLSFDHTLLSSSKRKVVDTSGNCHSRPKQESKIVKDQKNKSERSGRKIREKDQSER